jgi:hypothetical protein
MVCRSTPMGSALTSYVKILEGVEEYQSLSLYHEIMRDAPSRLASPSEDEKQAFVDEMSAKVETSRDFTTARKRSLQNRLATARDGYVAPEIFYASQRIEERARLAKVALDDYYSRTARDLGESVAQVRNRLSASYEESKRERTMIAPAEWQAEYRRRPGNAGLPMDRHTAYAMWRIDNEIAARTGRVTSRPTVTNHERVNGTGVSAVGYSPETGRLEVEFRRSQGQFYAYRDVPASVHAAIMASEHPTRTFNELVRNAAGNPYAYTSGHESDAAAVMNQCATCGQFAGENHGCPPRGSNEEIAATTARATIQQQVVRARRMVASGTEEQRLNGYLLTGMDINTARERIERENQLAESSPDTTMRHRQNQRLSARIYPYRGESGSFRCTALSTVRRIAGEEPVVNVPVTARINRVHDELTGQAVDLPMGTVTGRVQVRSEAGGYTVTPVAAPGDSGEDQLQCTCLDYRRNYDCVHIRQLVGDMNRRINQDVLSQRHAISDAVTESNAAAFTQFEESVAEQATVQERWAAGGDGVVYSGDEGAALFQEDYAAAKARKAAGEDPVGYMTENATDGLGARDGGRSFGTELEFTFPADMPYEDREMALERIGIEMYEAGLTPVEYQEDYGTRKRRGYTEDHNEGWSFEHDGSVDGEIISPIMYDEPETWENLQKVTDILRRNGASVDARVGSHVHVGTKNYDHAVENQNRLLGLFHEHEDEIYRLASNPERGTHRSAGANNYAAPNPRRATGFSNVEDAASANWGYYAINLEDTRRGYDSDHAEFRVFDGSLDASVIQSQIKLSLALTETAFRDTEHTPTGHTPFGSTRAAHREQHGATRRLTGEDWRASTEGVRKLADTLYRRREDKAQVAAMFAITKWSRTSR